jgi:hypothetical protein
MMAAVMVIDIQHGGIYDGRGCVFRGGGSGCTVMLL